VSGESKITKNDLTHTHPALLVVFQVPRNAASPCGGPSPGAGVDPLRCTLNLAIPPRKRAWWAARASSHRSYEVPQNEERRTSQPLRLSIYVKLGVGSRSAAVARGRALGYL